MSTASGSPCWPERTDAPIRRLTRSTQHYEILPGLAHFHARKRGFEAAQTGSGRAVLEEVEGSDPTRREQFAHALQEGLLKRFPRDTAAGEEVHRDVSIRTGSL